MSKTNFKKNQSDAQLQRDGYNRIHDSFTRSKTFNELAKAAEEAINIIKDCNIDKFQHQRLEEYGIHCYNRIQRRVDQMSFECSRNKFKR